MTSLQLQALQSHGAGLRGLRAGAILPSARELAEAAGVTRTVIRGLLCSLEALALVRKDGSNWVVVRRFPAHLFVSQNAVSKREKVINYLLLELAAGRLKPGDPLVELSLSRKLDVATVSVREALLEIQPLGIFKKARNRQWKVVAFDHRSLRELREFREMVEVFCLRKISADGLAGDRRERIEDVFSCTRATIQSTGVTVHEILAVDLRFHRSLIELADNRFIRENARFLYLLIELQLASPRYTVPRGLFGLRQHLKIISAILDDQYDAAEKHLLAHLCSAEETLHSIAPDNR